MALNRGLKAIALLVVALGVGCHRHGLAVRDGGASNSGAADSGSGPDRWPELPDLAPADLPAQDSVNLRDSLVASDPPLVGDTAAVEGSSPDTRPVDCLALRALAGSLLTSQRTRSVLFSPDGRSLILRAVADSQDSGDDVLAVDLPDGKMRRLGQGVQAVEWLGGGAVLMTSLGSSDLVVARLDGSSSFTLATATCGHAVSSDGARVYYNHDCRGAKSVSVTEVASRATTLLASNSLPGELAVSPSGRWVAYITAPGPSDASIDGGVVTVADATGKGYPISSVTSAHGPAFLSDQLLIFETSGSDHLAFNLYRHTPGIRDSSTLVGTGDPGFFGYQTARAGSAILLANALPRPARADELRLFPFDGTAPILLLADLFAYQENQLAIQAFTTSPASDRIIYMASAVGDGGLSLALASVSSSGDQRVVLSTTGDSFAVSPYAGRVAVVEQFDDWHRARITVVSSSTGAEAAAFESAQSIAAPTFVARDRGLIFVETSRSTPAGDAGRSPTRLTYLSFATGQSTVLGEWNSTELLYSDDSRGASGGGYPVDPNGCFVVYDGEPGTRLALLPE